MIAAAGSGILLYLAQEGRGIGLANKLRAYALQDQGLDTIDANSALGFDPDERFYQPAAEMLRQLGFTKIRLMTNNPDKLAALSPTASRSWNGCRSAFPSNAHNEAYLRTKAVRSGHFLDRMPATTSPGLEPLSQGSNRRRDGCGCVPAVRSEPNRAQRRPMTSSPSIQGAVGNVAERPSRASRGLPLLLVRASPRPKRRSGR